jgi:hypothetical protein
MERIRSPRRLVGLTLVAVLVGTIAAAGANASHLRPAHQIKLSLSQIQPLEGAFYELWVVRGARKESAGSFNVTEDGRLVDGFGHRARFFSRTDPARADALVVTIEPRPDPHPGPSGIAILAGSPRRHEARLRFPARLGQMAGSFILATPTDDDSGNETAGVWFLDPAAGPGPSLTLPDLPGGWVFEGWGVTQGQPLTTGSFTTASGADSAAPFSGPIPGPPFPGEDFLMNLPDGITPPVDLADGASAIVITVEPDLDGMDPTGEGPFSIKPLLASVPADAPDHTSLALARDLSTVPRGTATY